MRLSVVLCFKKTVNGYIFGGKHRLVKEVKYKAMEHLRQDMERQDKIMKLLRYPYLTKAESHGHAKALNKHDKWLRGKAEIQQMRGLKPSVTVEDRMWHLSGTDRWD